MNLHHLEYFVAVAAELNFTRAAQRLHVVQSAVSAAVRSLERELGAELFERTSQRVALTGAGEALLPKAVATLEAAREARDAVAGARGRLSGTLRLGGMPLGGLFDVPGLLGDYRELHPEVALRVRLSPEGTVGLVDGLLTGEIDVAFVSLGTRTPAGITARRLAAARMTLVAPAGHRLEGRGPVPLAELGEEDFIDAPAGYGNRDLGDRAFAAAGVSRRVVVEAADVATITGFVRRGLGVAYLPEFLPAVDPHGLAVLPALAPPTHWTLSLAWPSRRPPGPQVRALLELVDDRLEGYLGMPAADSAEEEAGSGLGSSSGSRHREA